MISFLAPVDQQMRAMFPAETHPKRVLLWLGSLYQIAIKRFVVTKPLQGWIFCALEKRA